MKSISFMLILKNNCFKIKVLREFSSTRKKCKNIFFVPHRQSPKKFGLIFLPENTIYCAFGFYRLQYIDKITACLAEAKIIPILQFTVKYRTFSSAMCPLMCPPPQMTAIPCGIRLSHSFG